MRGLARMELETVPTLVESPGEEDVGALLVAHRDGKDGAFRKLVERYRRPVYGYLVRCGVPSEDRDDLFQDVFVKIHQRAHGYQASRPLHPWLFTVVANTVRSYWSSQRAKPSLLSDPPQNDVEDPSPDAETVVSARETTAWLEGAIRELPLHEREVLLLASVENLKLKEIAEALEIPINTVKTHLRRARLRLVERLERRNENRS